jgi:serralysin
VVAFQSDDNADGGGGSGNVIRSRVFSTTTDSWTPVSINASTNDFVVDTTGTGDQTGQRVIRLFDGRVLEVWQSSDTGDGSGSAIRGRIVSATGDPTGAAPDFIVETTTTGNQSRPAILGFDDGRRLIYWHSSESSIDTIRGRFVHANGSLDASDFVIASLPDASAPTFGLSLLANQQVAFTYQGVASGDGLGAGIQLAIGSPSNLSLSAPFANTGASAFDPTLPSFSTSQAADQISRGNAPWNDVLGSSHSLTYSYRATSAGVSYSNGASGFTQFNAAQISAAEAAIRLWEDVAGITLTRVQDVGSQYSDSGQFLLWNYATSSAGSQAANASGFGGATFSGGSWHHFVYLNDDRALVTAPAFDNDGFRLFLHEIGHALGLSHPGNYNVLPGGASLAYDGNAVYREDTDQYTVMSYFDESITHANFVDTFAMTPLLHDIAAIQRLYGANNATRGGDTTYGFNSNAGSASYAIASSSQHAVFAVWDGGGNDTLDFSGYGARQIITLVPEKFSSVGGLEFNVVIAAGVSIENAIGGTGADIILGNDLDNRLTGGAGNDTIDGRPGTDTAVFSHNFNDYRVMDFGGRIIVAGPDGTDTLLSIELLKFDDVTLAVTDDGNPEFDALYYLSRNADVFHAGVNPFDHFNAYGWHEGRDPNPYFSVSQYLGANPDVKASGTNPLDHYHQSGWHEGRDPGAHFDTTLYLIHNPDVAAAGIDPLAHFLANGFAEGRQAYDAIGTAVKGFDAEWYLFHNPDVAAAGVDPLAHFNANGWHEGRNPNAYFDTAGYLAHYADVAAAGVNPLQHYEQYGWMEGRDPSAGFDTLGYLAANPDVAAAHVNPLDHYLNFGVYEGRTPVNDGLWH